MKINSAIAREAATYAGRYLSERLDDRYCYHNLQHTIEVAEACETLANRQELPSDEVKRLLVAAWFHDTGYVIDVDNHETHGAALAESFLKERGIDEADIKSVTSMILATRYPQQPATEAERILCDADLFHLGGKDFFKKSVQLREEHKLLRGKEYTDTEWLRINFDFVNGHSFHTSYYREKSAKRKEKHKKKLREMLEIREEGTKKKSDKPDRGVETLFRNASRNHMQLSSMADTKAHILLSINSIIISVVLSVLGKKVTDNPALAIPVLMLMAVCLVTIVFAVLTTKPKITHGFFTREQIQKREANLLFFGNFHKMNLRDYEWGIGEVMNDREYLYKSLTRDVYFLGKVLATKYRLLRTGYNIFMYGLIATVIVFSVAVFITTP